MAIISQDRVAEIATTTGTGDFTLAGAITGYRSFSSVCAVGNTFYYLIEAVDASGVPTGSWETGLGTYSATDTLTRTTVLASSNAGAAVSFAAGTKRVSISAVAASIARLEAVFEDQKAVNTGGGTPTVGSFATRTLNTEAYNDIPGASLASDQITLSAGTYEVEASSGGYRTNRYRARLQDVTNGVTLLLSDSTYSDSSTSGSQVVARIAGRFTLTGTVAIELQCRAEATSGGANGLGVPSNFGVTEVYSRVKIRKLR